MTLSTLTDAELLVRYRECEVDAVGLSDLLAEIERRHLDL